MGCCSSSAPPEEDKNSGSDRTTDATANQGTANKTPSKKDLLAKKASNLELPNTVKATSVDLKDSTHARSKTQEEEEQHARQLSYLDKVYREKRITQAKEKEAKLAKLNSDRTERIEKQWTDREKTKHFTARDLFYKMCKEHPYDPFKYETYIKSFYEDDDDENFGLGTRASVIDDEDDDDDDIDETLWIPKDINRNELIDKNAFFIALGELLLPIPSIEEFHKNLDKTQFKESDVKNMENEITKQRAIIWKFFIYTPDEFLHNQKEREIKTYMTYDDFSTGLSALISATVDWRSKAHKAISDCLFQVFDHDRDGYLDYHDITALLLALHKIYAAVFNYEAAEVVSRDDVEERSTALLGMDWGPSKVDQPVQYLNKRQFAHLFGELGEKHLKDLDLENILSDDINDPGSPRALRT